MIAAIYARKSTEQTGVADDAKSVTRQVEHKQQHQVVIRTSDSQYAGIRSIQGGFEVHSVQWSVRPDRNPDLSRSNQLQFRGVTRQDRCNDH